MSARRTAIEIAELTVYHGKRQVPLKEFFDIEGALQRRGDSWRSA
ncbi:MAG: hypothetical protein R3C49_20605 [Planctomycetaceae bacterium]